jgi:ABC-type multidrug transport system fused ATPase/permease subunit
VLVAVEPKGALSAFAALTLFGYVWQAKTRPRLQRAGDARLWSDALRLKQLQEGFGGAKDAKLLGREQQLIADYAIQSRAAADAAQTYDTLQQLPRLVLELGTVVVLAAVVVALLAAGRRPADVVVVIGVFAAAAFRLMPSFNRAVIALQTLHYDAATLALLEKELRELKPEPAPSSRTAMTLTDGVSLRNVSFTYPGASRPALRAVSLDVKARETVGFVGPSGAGKTTLAEIFVGLLSPDHGVVTVDGRPMQDSLRDWQSQVGFVPQSVFLTDGTIRSNVAFGLASSDIVEATVWRALAVAQMDAFVRSLPAGLETVIGERGVRLSGGQRQRLGIARALYNDPAVLVLDEATNALDDATETGVLEAVRALHGTRTIVVVAHRASTVGYCDRVFVFDEGRLCDDAGGVWRGPVVGGRAAATVTRSRS